MDENERRGVEGYILKLELATEVGRRGDPARHGPCDQLARDHSLPQHHVGTVLQVTTSI